MIVYSGVSRCFHESEEGTRESFTQAADVCKILHKTQNSSGVPRWCCVRPVIILLTLWGLTLIWGVSRKELDCSFMAECMESWCVGESLLGLSRRLIIKVVVGSYTKLREGQRNSLEVRKRLCGRFDVATVKPTA